MQSTPLSNPNLQRRSHRETPSPSFTLPFSAASDKRHSVSGKPSTPSTMLGRFFSLRPPVIVVGLILLIVFTAFIIKEMLSTNLIRATLCQTLATSSELTSSLSLSDDRVPVLDRTTDDSADSLRPMAWARLTHLIMVAGHAIYTGLNYDDASLRDESNWILEPFQHGQVSTFLRHIERGVSKAANDSSSLLIFSGGQTRDGAGPRSEAQTYWAIADAARWYGFAHSAGVANRSFAEEYARDSFENLLFSICRFHQLTGRYPKQITVVGFEFKRDRFVSIHRRALRFPLNRFEYVGIDPTASDGIRGVSARERSTAHGPFASDPYGCNTRVLYEKRQTRNPYLRFHPYPQGCPHLKQLFNYCGRTIFRGALPWDPRILSNSRSKPDMVANNDSNIDNSTSR